MDIDIEPEGQNGDIEEAMDSEPGDALPIKEVCPMPVSPKEGISYKEAEAMDFEEDLDAAAVLDESLEVDGNDEKIIHSKGPSSPVPCEHVCDNAAAHPAGEEISLHDLHEGLDSPSSDASRQHSENELGSPGSVRNSEGPQSPEDDLSTGKLDLSSPAPSDGPELDVASGDSGPSSPVHSDGPKSPNGELAAGDFGPFSPPPSDCPDIDSPAGDLGPASPTASDGPAIDIDSGSPAFRGGPMSPDNDAIIDKGPEYPSADPADVVLEPSDFDKTEAQESRNLQETFLPQSPVEQSPGVEQRAGSDAKSEASEPLSLDAASAPASPEEIEKSDIDCPASPSVASEAGEADTESSDSGSLPSSPQTPGSGHGYSMESERPEETTECSRKPEEADQLQEKRDGGFDVTQALAQVDIDKEEKAKLQEEKTVVDIAKRPAAPPKVAKNVTSSIAEDNFELDYDEDVLDEQLDKKPDHIDHLDTVEERKESSHKVSIRKS